MNATDSDVRVHRRFWFGCGVIGLLGVLVGIAGLVITLRDGVVADACIEFPQLLDLCGAMPASLSDYAAWLIPAALGLLLLAGSVGVLRATRGSPD